MPREADPALDGLVRLAARVCDMPMGAVNLIDEDRQWQIAAVGTEPADAPRAASHCDVTVQHSEPLVIADARLDCRFADRAFTNGERGVLRS